MPVDERGFDSEAPDLESLSREALLQFIKAVALENSKIKLENRLLKIELDQIRTLTTENGFDKSTITKIRNKVIEESLTKIGKQKQKRGRKKNYDQALAVAELHRLYELLDDKKLTLKTWLRSEIEKDFVKFVDGISLVARSREIDRLVQKYATAITRYKQNLKKSNLPK
ncbi:hypothetical protein ACMYR3_10110 [Ampullimonas aquatilis]|uniref:hypothetical protein n=1 Tax=Ampullimonas aquatilis TaxID=1341549 RepID=UPI003C75FE67